MDIFLLAHDKASVEPAFERVLSTNIPNLATCASLDELAKYAIKRKGSDPVTAIVLLPAGDRRYFDELVDFAQKHASQIFLVLVSGEIAASDYKRLVRTGGADWISKSSDPGEILGIIARSRTGAPLGETRRTGARPVSVAFVPSAGGVGNTTLTLETAAYIVSDKANQQRKLCIVDFDFQTSHICDYLDSEPRLSIAELSSAPERLDQHLFESFRTQHSSGIDVFAAPRSKFDSSTLDIRALDALLSMIASRYDIIFMDFPLQWFHWSAQVLAASDGVIITGINTIPCLRQISETLALLRSSASYQLEIGIAINRCERTLLGKISRRRHAEMALPDETLFFVPDHPEAVESVNMGLPMMLGPSARKVRRDVEPLGQFCATVATRSSASR